MHHPMTSEVLSRFHHALVEEIRERRPEYLEKAFTVAEIYQNLVPYRTHRDRIGVEMNGDYEDALLRLLAGEGDYLVLESDHARRELEAELESSNPNTGLFREFAAADVRLNPDRLTPSGPDPLFGGPATLDLGGDAVPVEDLAPPPPAEAPARMAPPASFAGPPVEEAVGAERTPSPGTEADGPRAEAAQADEDVACRWCRETLPRRDNLNYCPFCGANAHLVPCPNCGEELEPEWRFCVACGSEVGDAV